MLATLRRFCNMESEFHVITALMVVWCLMIKVNCVTAYLNRTSDDTSAYDRPLIAADAGIDYSDVDSDEGQVANDAIDADHRNRTSGQRKGKFLFDSLFNVRDPFSDVVDDEPDEIKACSCGEYIYVYICM